MQKLNLKTIAFLSDLVEKPLEREVADDFRELIAQNGQVQTISIKKEYLTPRKETLIVSATSGKWDRKKQEKIFILDDDIEKYCVGESDRPTPFISAKIFDWVKEKAYKQFAFDDGILSFANLSQSLQVMWDYHFLIKEILEYDNRMIIPFLYQRENDKNNKPKQFIVNAFRYKGKIKIKMGTNGLINSDICHTQYGNVIIMPRFATRSITKGIYVDPDFVFH
ncbi:MAG TPA: hypothetical protein VMR49_02780 [Candidatus Paceibacterota bacterium]|nr:hypothetical protein [Candidatus Paceibacterota bacterium]